MKVLLTIVLAAIFRSGYSQQDGTCDAFSPSNPNICCTNSTLLSDDNPPDECIGFDVLNFVTTGICNENFDCCRCAQINVLEAQSFNCGGDFGCFWLGRLFIDGVPTSSGAVITCGGDHSCEHANLDGNNVGGINCDGDDACRATTIDFNTDDFNELLKPIAFICNGDSTCRESKITAANVGGMACNGDHSCEDGVYELNCTNNVGGGCSITGGGDFSFFKTTMTATTVNVFQCGGDDSCKNTNFNFACMPPLGCKVNCGGDRSCRDSIWNLEQANLLECVGDYSCANTILNALCIDAGCPVRCSAESPCLGATFSVINSYGLFCGGLSNACKDATFRLINNLGGCLNCLGLNGCRNAVINGGDDDLAVVNIGQVSCSGDFACDESSIDVICDVNTGCLVQCQGTSACNNIFNSIEIENVKSFSCGANAINTQACNGNFELSTFDNSFTLTCGSATSCQNGEFEIEVKDDISSLLCVANQACQLAEFELTRPGDGLLKIGTFICGSLESCQGMEFSVSNSDNGISRDAIQIDLFSCSGIESCKELNIDFTATAINVIIRCTGLDSCVDLVIDVTNVDNANGQDVPGLVIECFIVNLRNTCEGAMIVNGILEGPVIA